MIINSAMRRPIGPSAHRPIGTSASATRPVLMSPLRSLTLADSASVPRWRIARLRRLTLSASRRFSRFSASVGLAHHRKGLAAAQTAGVGRSAARGPEAMVAVAGFKVGHRVLGKGQGVWWAAGDCCVGVGAGAACEWSAASGCSSPARWAAMRGVRCWARCNKKASRLCASDRASTCPSRPSHSTSPHRSGSAAAQRARPSRARRRGQSA